MQQASLLLIFVVRLRLTTKITFFSMRPIQALN